MKRKIVLITLIILIITGCNKNKTETIKNNNKESDPILTKVNKLMDKMSIEEKIAQMLVVYYAKDTVDDNLKKSIKSTPFGGFILTRDNITTYDKTLKFVKDLQNNSSIPMIISIDEEGGNVQRLEYINDKKVTHIPYMYELGKTNDISLAYDTAKVMAEELRTIGVNVTYAPVLDVYSNPNNPVIGKRSFSENPNIVSNMALSFSKGLEENKVISTFKHFPGHGDTDTDSHISLPIINKTYEELKETELIPFQKAIDSGAKIIMIGHIALPKIVGDNTPSSLSKKIVTNILKKDMHYDGLVITDALNMGALTNNYTDEEIYIKTIEAGVDLLLMPNGSKKAIEIIKKKVSEDRINESVRKILLFKYNYLNETNYLDESYLGSSEHQNIINKIKNSN